MAKPNPKNQPKRVTRKKTPVANYQQNMEQNMEQAANSFAELTKGLMETPTKPRTTMELLGELGNVLSRAEGYSEIVHDFLQPEGRSAPVVESLPPDPNARLIFLIKHVKALESTLHSTAHILGAV